MLVVANDEGVSVMVDPAWGGERFEELLVRMTDAVQDHCDAEWMFVGDCGQPAVCDHAGD